MSIAIRIFYKNIGIRGLENVPEKGPIIFALNHQNSFLDAFLVTGTTPRNPYFLARADAFNNKIASFLMDIIKIMPIYRIRDGISNLKKNEQVIDRCRSIMQHKHPVLIFPEASHEYKCMLRPLHKGIARIAFGTEFASEISPKVIILPVGVHYENYKQAGYNVLINYGKPIKVSDYEDIYKENPKEAMVSLCDNLALQMKDLMVDIQPPERYHDNYEKWMANRGYFRDLWMQFDHDQKLVQEINNEPEKYSSDPNANLKSPRKWRFFLWPVYAFSYISFIIPHLIVKGLLKYLFNDDQFEASVKVSIWFIIAPEALVFQALIIYLLSNLLWVAVLYVFLSLIFGYLTMKFYFPK